MTRDEVLEERKKRRAAALKAKEHKEEMLPGGQLCKYHQSYALTIRLYPGQEHLVLSFRGKAWGAPDEVGWSTAAYGSYVFEFE